MLVATKLLLRQAYFCRDKDVFVTTKHVFYRNKHVFLSRQNASFVATKVCLSRQNFCCDKHIFVATKTFLSRQNTSFIATNTFLSRQNASFVATKFCLSRQNSACRDKTRDKTTKVLFATKTILSPQMFCCGKHTFVIFLAHERFKKMLFIMTKYNIRFFMASPFFKLQNNT